VAEVKTPFNTRGSNLPTIKIGFSEVLKQLCSNDDGVMTVAEDGQFNDVNWYLVFIGAEHIAIAFILTVIFLIKLRIASSPSVFFLHHFWNRIYGNKLHRFVTVFTLRSSF